MKFVNEHKKAVSIISAVLFVISVAKTYLLWGTLDTVLQVVSVAFVIFFLVFAVLPWFLKETPKS